MVKNIDESLKLYESLGYVRCSEKIDDQVQHNWLQFIKDGCGEQTLELIEPADERSTLYQTKLKGYHHICYEVPDLDEYVAAFEASKIGKVFTRPITAPAFGRRKVLFAMLKTGVIVEFLEAEKS